MASSREVITLQLGNYANYIGSHWWNIQESYFQYDEGNPSELNHDVLFREGKTLRGQTTFTPRMVLIDKGEKMANVPTLVESTSQNDFRAQENDNVSVQEQNISEKHEFIKDLEKIDNGQRVDLDRKDYNFEETTRTWCDFLRTKYHPKSVLSYSNFNQTEVFHVGGEIYRDLEEEFVERIRGYAEECDRLQGFQVLVDSFDANGGLADSTLNHLHDEYPSKCILTIPVISGEFAEIEPVDEMRRTINILFSYIKLRENSHLLVPLGTNKTAWRSLGPPTTFPNIRYNSRSPYHTSGILAAFLDTVTLKYRIREDYCFMSDFVSGLNYYNKKICAASMSLPFPIAQNSYLWDTLENLDETRPLWSILTPGCNFNNESIFYQRITVRGIPPGRLVNPRPNSNSRANVISSVEEMVHMYLSFRLTSISNVTSVNLPLKTEVPFPKIFSPHVSSTGSVDESVVRMENYSVNFCPVITGLHCCRGVGRMLDSLYNCVKAVNIKRFHFFSAYLDVDEFNDCLERILALGQIAEDFEMR